MINEILKKNKIIPIATITNKNDLSNVCTLLIDNQITLIEVTLRDPMVESIINYFNDYTKINFSLGTVKNIYDLDLAISNNIKLAFSPGFSKQLSKYAFDNNIDLIPGVETPTDVLQATIYGHKILKFFPAEISGGIKKLNFFKNIYPDISFIPTGGINNTNFINYLKVDNVISVGASSILDSSKISNKDWNGINQDIMEHKNIIKNLLEAD